MRFGFIGDIVGRPGRKMISRYLKEIKSTQHLDYVVANYENASHGFGLTPKNGKELLEYGIDLLTGGNHTWDKKDIFSILEEYPILRPLNYPKTTPGKGVHIEEKLNLAVINLMGHFGMPTVDNAFVTAQEIVKELKKKGIENIFIDFHAEATSEKRAMFLMLKKEISAIAGTHTHIGTDDLTIVEGCGYVSDVGLTGCRDNVLGMEEEAAIKAFLTGIPHRFDVPKKCKAILQMVVFEFEKGRCKEAYKIKAYDDEGWEITQKAKVE
ncbi:MAG: YmdB family metallophosphoesterase [Epsilonproteobacteria bacterium]|nr:YmdB family metallophosphoesterase [Campylobacterota bacterium]